VPLRRSDLQKRAAADLGFLWATGIEDTFITEMWPQTGRTLDEYALTGHYIHWRRDLDLMASLGVKTARYGIPWHRIQPSPDEWDWTWADGPLNRLIELGIDPIVDLVHYGLPSWIDGAFTNPNYPAFVAAFARRVAERFQGAIHCYTPLNEPRITAWYCGRLGWWPPHGHGERGYLAVMHGVCRGIVRTAHALREADPENVIVHVDATDLYEAASPDLAAQTTLRQTLVFLALDLITGRVTPTHALWNWCLRRGMSEWDLDWFIENAIEIDICGINLYPMFSQKVIRKDDSSGGRVRIRMPYASAEIVDRLVRMYTERYCVPIMITETASRGPVARRAAWLTDCVEAIRRCRGEGLPLIGYTWWPMFALIAWAYRQGVRDPSAYIEQMGLWDLVADEKNEELRRVETDLVEQYRFLAERGAESAGRLLQPLNELVGV
jgi:beta-glucosidase